MIEKMACILNCATQNITKHIFMIKTIGNASPKKAKNQKFSGEMYLDAIDEKRPMIAR